MFQRLAANTAPLRRKAPNVAFLDRNSRLWFPWLPARPNAPVSTNVSVKVNYLGQSSTRYPVNVVGVAPAIFQGAVLNQSGSLNTAENPAAVGSVVVFWMTGEGQTNPLGLTGRITEINNSSTGPLTPQPLITPTVTIGGQAAKVHFYGEAPDLVSGILQINVEVPAGLPAGSWPLVVSFGPISSQGGITVAVQ